MEMTMNIVDFKSVKLEGILAKIFFYQIRKISHHHDRINVCMHFNENIVFLAKCVVTT